MKNMANCNFVVSILGMMIGAAIMNAASEFPLEFTENGPGAGFWPFALGTALTIAAVVLLIYTISNKKELSKELVALTLPANMRVYMMMAIIVVYVGLINVLGFYPASALLIPATMKLMDFHNKKVIAMTTVGTIAFIYLVFSVLLHTQMPQSMFLE
ncbi:MAG: tripartite tricarboxylate transporter TctB family protein [Phascolarctobacterium sp.]|nr:tripartite tricarboxylate transporter TctB family protein [Phascolarctobacterium sp.]MBR6679336.1 tripartite tricarboxylate transporter TctB family protein [Phascolarctobacterium sp.]